MLAFTILRRMKCVLDVHREQVKPILAAASSDQSLAARLRRDFQLNFWNRSPHTLKSLLGDPEHLAADLIDYVSQFSVNESDIFEQYGFTKTLRRLEDKRPAVHRRPAVR
jgi:type I restriction enzyme M protein